MNPETPNTQPVAEQQQEAQESGEPAMLFCPVCDHRLEQSRCKLVCRTCGYFMSCADYY